MDPASMDYTMQHPDHHHPHYHHHHHHHHHYQTGPSSAAAANRCPALRAAAEQRNIQLPQVSSTRSTVQYDPVHGHINNRNLWQSRSPQNWRPAIIPPYPQDPLAMGTFSPPFTASSQPSQSQFPACPIPSGPDAHPQTNAFQQFRTTMHPAPRLQGQLGYDNLGGFGASSNSNQPNTQQPLRPLVQRANTSLPSAASLLPAPAPQISPSRQSTTPRQMGQATSFGNENSRPGQQLPSFLPNMLTHQDASQPFPRQTPDSVPQTTAHTEESSAASHIPSGTTSTVPQRISDRVMNPVEIRRATTAAMSRSRRVMSRYTASPPSEWLYESNPLQVRRADVSLVEYVENYPAAVSDGEGPVTGRFMRGGPAKRVASKRALASLQSVNIADLPESERTCVICYNDFGVANPEGVNEAPLRLPKCKHVFGDHCIKKWFKESDSCPYCRDKVHSELQTVSARRNHAGSRFPYHMTAQYLQEYQGYQGREQARPHDRDPSESDSSNQPGQSTATNATDRVRQFPVRPDSSMRHSVRLPWNAGYERRSPPAADSRRRARQRARVSPPSTRTSVFGGPTPNGASHTSVSFPPEAPAPTSFLHPMSTRVDLSSPRLLTKSFEQYPYTDIPSHNPTTEPTTLNPPPGSALDTYGMFAQPLHHPPHENFPFQRIGVPLSEEMLASQGEQQSAFSQIRSDPIIRSSSPSASSGSSSDIPMAGSDHHGHFNHQQWGLSEHAAAPPTQLTSYQQS
ncbi:hypothetical protein F5B22DRAFT_650936 [Xylaria bambusicola]|uniref:uncharacterized protein n=1 Tax=Xylaria bambusicola TaxID=326684 RepID=UPI002008750C|nr:uncharacterized protein F5B22DRAFT_650936 [Xylaria bambusicola]KAI0506229.1 hypothetical protein F5B22DRAFT_650936 [Xylaria bambusicola]